MSRFHRSVAVCGAVLLVAVAWCARPVPAAIVTFQLSGTLLSADSSGAPGGDFFLAPDVVVGAPYTGLLSYDLSAVGADSFGGKLYNFAPPFGSLGLSITVGGQTFVQDPQFGFGITIIDGTPGDLPPPVPPGDVTQIGGQVRVDQLLYSAGAYDLAIGRYDHVSLNMTDSSGSAFSDASLPTSLNAADFGYREFQIHRTSSPVVHGFLSGNVPFYSLGGTIDSITLVPEPSTVVLGGLAWILFAWRAFSRSALCSK